MKKFIALLCVFTLLGSMTVLAAESPSAAAVVSEAPAATTFNQNGFTSYADVKAAATRGMSAGEYYNNAVVNTPGVADAMPVGQGGKIVINGVVTNLVANLAKANATEVTGAKEQTAQLGGKLLNVLNVTMPGANFTVATVNFYLPGFAAGTKVMVRQFVNGEWIDVEVAEARLDHVVLNLKYSGTIVFVEVPAGQAPVVEVP